MSIALEKRVPSVSQPGEMDDGRAPESDRTSAQIQREKLVMHRQRAQHQSNRVAVYAALPHEKRGTILQKRLEQRGS